MRDTELIAELAARLDREIPEVESMLDAFGQIVADRLADNDIVALEGWGQFELKKKAERYSADAESGKCGKLDRSGGSHASAGQPWWTGTCGVGAPDAVRIIVGKIHPHLQGESENPGECSASKRSPTNVQRRGRSGGNRRDGCGQGLWTRPLYPI